MPIGVYYHGIAVFKRERANHKWNYDWADLNGWERHIWGVRQDYEMAGQPWRGVVEMVNPSVYTKFSRTS